MKCLTHSYDFHESDRTDAEVTLNECPRAWAYKFGIPARWIDTSGPCLFESIVLKVVCSWCNRFQSGNRFSSNISHTVCSPCYHKEMQRIRSQGTPLQKEIERRFN